MSVIILDAGSGNTLKDDITAIKLIDEVVKRDTKKHEVIFKAQLFESAPPNIPLDHHVFLVARAYAWSLGYKMTSSVFDVASLRFLLSLDNPKNELPFVKVACRPDLYWLIGEVPRRVPVYVSVTDELEAKSIQDDRGSKIVPLVCVPKYPAYCEDYWDVMGDWNAMSDHTEGWDAFYAHQPWVIEKHICLERDPKNPDSGPFSILPTDLEEIL